MHRQCRFNMQYSVICGRGRSVGHNDNAHGRPSFRTRSSTTSTHTAAVQLVLCVVEARCASQHGCVHWRCAAAVKSRAAHPHWQHGVAVKPGTIAATACVDTRSPGRSSWPL
jgi:hypothetical protein